MKQTKPNSRRKFLLSASLGGAGAAVAVVAGRSLAPVRPDRAARAEAEPQGYHVSEHILKYYKTTLV